MLDFKKMCFCLLLHLMSNTDMKDDISQWFYFKISICQTFSNRASCCGK